MRNLAVAVLSLAILAPAATVAQAPNPPPMVSDPLVVKAANRARTLGYVRAATQLSPSGQVSKRPRRLCPVVAGAESEVNGYVHARLREVAGEVGVQFESRACRPNLLVLFSREPEEMLRQARKRGKILYDEVSIPRVDRFKANVHPVRWLSRTRELPVYGQTEGGYTGAEFASARAPDSHIVRPVASVLHHSIVVVDARKADGVPVAALADYVSLVALTDIKPDAVQPDQTSILNLFASPDAPKRMSNADRAYLRAVYKVRGNVGAGDQLGVLATAMADELER